MCHMHVSKGASHLWTQRRSPETLCQLGNATGGGNRWGQQVGATGGGKANKIKKSPPCHISGKNPAQILNAISIVNTSTLGQGMSTIAHRLKDLAWTQAKKLL
jgi:hypothetical protein